MTKIKIIGLIVLVLGVIIGIVIWKNPKENNNDSKKVDESLLAIMVYDKNQNKYVKSDTFPVGAYQLNTELSHCDNGSPIGTYNNSTGTMTTSLNKTDKCKYYFDIVQISKYWNEGIKCESQGGYSFPNTPSITYTSFNELIELSGISTDGYYYTSKSAYYIKTTSSQHMACLSLTETNKEFCFTAGYWSSDANTTKNKLQNEMATDLGVSSTQISCNTNSTNVYCKPQSGNFGCTAYSNGNVDCGWHNNVEAVFCSVYSNHNADCQDQEVIC